LVGWMVEPEDRRKAQAGRRLEGMAGGSAGGDGRRSGRRRNRKVGWRRESKAGGKVGSEGWLKARAGNGPEDLLKDLTVDEGLEVEVGRQSRRWIEDASRRSIGRRG